MGGFFALIYSPFLMRIPFYIVILLCIITALSIWFYGTQDKDFITPPSDEKLSQIREQWREDHTDKTLPQISTDPSPSVGQNLEKAKPIPDPTAAAKLTVTDTNSDNKLSLFHYKELAKEKSAQAIIAFAQDLESKGKKSRALLAWERVLDTCKSNTEERTAALIAIKKLRSEITQPLQPFSETLATLTLNIGASIRDTSSLQKSVDSITQQINGSAAGVINCESQLIIGIPQGDQPPKTAIAIWLSTLDPEATKTRETAPLSAIIDIKKNSAIDKSLELAFYGLVKSELNKLPDFSHLPAELDTHSITRFMWHEIIANIGSK